MGPLFHTASMKKYLDNPQATMGWLAIFSALIALDVLNKIIEVIGGVLGNLNDSFLLVNGIFLVFLYAWILYFLVVVSLAAFQKWRRAKV